MEYWLPPFRFTRVSLLRPSRTPCSWTRNSGTACPSGAMLRNRGKSAASEGLGDSVMCRDGGQNRKNAMSGDTLKKGDDLKAAGPWSVFGRKPAPDLIRGWIPVRVKKARQNRNLEPRF